MPSIDFEVERAVFRDYYNDNAFMFQDAASFFESLMTAILSETTIEIDTVSSRVKDREECIAKFSRKYREKLEQTQTPYSIKDWITDLIGLRIVCLYEPDIYLIEKVLSENFLTHDETDKSEALEATDSSFGYKGLHMDLGLGSGREDFAEYRRYKSLRIEVQIRTISQDAWSTIDHKIKYKRNIPKSLRRRIYRLAALFELADQEFLNIRDLSRSEQERSENIANDPTALLNATALDIFGFIGVMRKFYPNFSAQEDRADAFLQEILASNPKLRARDLVKILDDNLPVVGAYKITVSFRLNPFTEMRHALFRADSKTYESLLFPTQRGSFVEWLHHYEERHAARQRDQPASSSDQAST